MKDDFRYSPLDALFCHHMMEKERRARTAQETQASSGRRQAAFARAAEALAGRGFANMSERVAAEIALARFFAGAE